MRHHLVLRVVSKILMPFIILFGLYVQFHGDFGPGGGFQAGVIVAAGVILYALVFGLETARAAVPDRAVLILVPLGLLIYAGTGFVTLFLGGGYLDYDVLGSTPTAGQHLGIIVIEFGVGVTVASVMVAVFYAFAGRSDEIEDGDW